MLEKLVIFLQFSLKYEWVLKTWLAVIYVSSLSIERAIVFASLAYYPPVNNLT